MADIPHEHDPREHTRWNYPVLVAVCASAAAAVAWWMPALGPQRSAVETR